MSAEANTKSLHMEEKSSTNVSPKHAGTAADGMEETMREHHILMFKLCEILVKNPDIIFEIFNYPLGRKTLMQIISQKLDACLKVMKTFSESPERKIHFLSNPSECVESKLIPQQLTKKNIEDIRTRLQRFCIEFPEKVFRSPEDIAEEIVEEINSFIKKTQIYKMVVGICGPVATGKSTIINSIKQIYDNKGQTVHIFSTDKGNTYQFIEREIGKIKKGIIIIDTGFSSGFPDWVNCRFCLDIPDPNFAFIYSMLSAIVRENHPTIQIPKTGVLESELAVKTLAVEEISSKDTYKDRSIQELINECPSEIFKQWIDSIKHQIRGKWVTGKHKKGDIIYITYIHEGAKMWNSIGVTLRNPGFIFDGEKWLCIALKTPLGPEIGVQKGWEEESEDKGNGIEEHKMIMKMIAKGKGVLNGILSFKMDGQMIGVTFVTGDRKRLVMETIISWGEYITDDSTGKTFFKISKV